MSLDRASSKKQYLDLNSGKRESNFIKVPQVPTEPKSVKKPGSSQGLDNDDSTERQRKATLSPLQKDSGSKGSVTKQGHKVLAQTLSKTKKISYIKQLVKKS